MSGPYAYTPYIWPMLATAVFMAAFSVYSWRRRSVPGALPFVFLTLFWSLIAIGAALELAAVAISTKVFWSKFQFFWHGPGAVAGLWFVLDYAGLTRSLTRTHRLLLLLFPILGSLLILTNEVHHWIWSGSSYDGALYPLRGIGYWALVVPGFLLALLTLPILIWLFIRSPLHRWPVALILCGQLAVRVTFPLEVAKANPIAPLAPSVLASNLLTLTFAIALFGFYIFDPIPLARRTVIEQMSEGMVILDKQRLIAGLNPAATCRPRPRWRKTRRREDAVTRGRGDAEMWGHARL